MLALAACGVDAAHDGDASMDASLDATDDVSDAASDAHDDDGGLDAFAPGTVDAWPLPDGCAVFGQPTTDASCGYTVSLNDPVACTVDVDAGTQDADLCVVLCDPYEAECVYTDLTLADGGHEYVVGCGGGDGCVGRLHERARADLARRCARGRFNRGAWLARAAALEATSVEAFEILAEELERFGAPEALVADARRAARDEVRHARATTVLASRFGARVPSRARGRRRRRDLRTVAVENAAEGCVRETFGAALAAWQAACARDATVRRAMRSIARDEARHADLAWRIDAWVADVALEDARAARGDAIRALRASVAAFGGGDEILGLPDATSAGRLLDALFADELLGARNERL